MFLYTVCFGTSRACLCFSLTKQCVRVCVRVCVCVLDEERPVALGQRSYVSEEASRRSDPFYIQRICRPLGVYVSVTHTLHTFKPVHGLCV